MSPPITMFADVTVNVQGAVPQPLDFGTLALVGAHSITANRLDGPYGTLAEVVAAGFTSAAAAAIYAKAAMVFSQVAPALRTLFIGRIDGADADLTASLDAVEAAGSDDFHKVTIASRTADDIYEAAAWCEPRNNESLKFGVFQSNDLSVKNGTGAIHTLTVGGAAADGTYTTEFDGYGLDAPVEVDVVRATTPATNADLAAAIAVAITALVGTTLLGVVATAVAVGAVVTITLVQGLTEAGTITGTAPVGATLVDVVTDSAIADRLSAAGFRQCILVYQADDAQNLDVAAATKLGGFKLDQPGGVGVLHGKRLQVVPYSNLDPDEAIAIQAGNANFFGRKFGLNFFVDGRTPAGPPYFADITTTIHWFTRRAQEAAVTLMTSTPTKIGFNQAGINAYANAVQGVLSNGVQFGHFLGDPGLEPFIESAGIATITVGDKQIRVLRLVSNANRATFDGAIQKLVLAINMSFG